MRMRTADRGVDHVLLTRFNLPSAGVEGLIRAREGWLHHRVELFERYCARSVAGQTRPVTWIIYFDPESPSWLLERLAPLVDRGLFRPILRASVSREEFLSDIAESLTSPGRHLVTTNLDNDDGLAIDFSERVTSANARTTGPSSTSRGAWSRALGACSCAGIR